LLDISRFTLRALAVAVLAVLIAALALPGRPTEAAVTALDVGMSGVFENPSVDSPGFGTAHFTFDDSTRVLTYAVTISGLSPDQVTMAHIHRGAVGANGPIIRTLSSTGFTQISGQVTLTEDEAADLKAGNLYVNARSVANPGGFARGQLFLNPVDSLAASAKAAVAAYNAQDIDRLSRFFTDAGFQTEFQVSKAEAKAHPDEVFQGPVSFHSISDVQVTGSIATSTMSLGIGAPGTAQVLQYEHDSWVLDAGLWRVAASQPIDTPLPTSGVTIVNVQLVNFAFNFNKSLTSSGNIAFHFANAGTEEHEAVLVKLNTDKSLDAIANDLLQGGPDAPPPPYAEFIAGNSAVPGGEFNYVFTQPLSPGRYAFFCFENDPASGLPHVALGMRADFTVGGGATGIQPPSTGDAGLVRHGSNRGVIDVSVGLLAFAVLGGAALVFARRRA
jgi:hypothetical protein